MIQSIKLSQNNKRKGKNIDKRVADPVTDEIVSVRVKKSLLSCFKMLGKSSSRSRCIRDPPSNPTVPHTTQNKQ